MEWDDRRGEPSIPNGLSNVVAIAAGPSHNLALKNEGTVVAWGYSTTSETEVPVGLNNVVAISAGGHTIVPLYGFSLALKKDGTIVAWGEIAIGSQGIQLARVPAGLTNVVAIAAGDNFCLAITTNSAVADKFRH